MRHVRGRRRELLLLAASCAAHAAGSPAGAPLPALPSVPGSLGIETHGNVVGIGCKPNGSLRGLEVALSLRTAAHPLHTRIAGPYSVHLFLKRLSATEPL
jgi:hypothetical protein